MLLRNDFLVLKSSFKVLKLYLLATVRTLCYMFSENYRELEKCFFPS